MYTHWITFLLRHCFVSVSAGSVRESKARPLNRTRDSITHTRMINVRVSYKNWFIKEFHSFTVKCSLASAHKRVNARPPPEWMPKHVIFFINYRGIVCLPHLWSQSTSRAPNGPARSIDRFMIGWARMIVDHVFMFIHYFIDTFSSSRLRLSVFLMIYHKMPFFMATLESQRPTWWWIPLISAWINYDERRRKTNVWCRLCFLLDLRATFRKSPLHRCRLKMS